MKRGYIKNLKNIRKSIHVRFLSEIAAVLAIASATRFYHLFQPATEVFDEKFYRFQAANYITHNFYFDVHPPLGKLIYYVFAKIIHLSAESITGSGFVYLRILPALCGVLLVYVVWATLRTLGVSRKFAFLASFIMALEPILIVESRYVLIEPFLKLAVFFSFYSYAMARIRAGNSHRLWLVLSIISAGLAASIKWTGLTALLILVIWYSFDTGIKKPLFTTNKKLIVTLSGIFFVVFIMYLTFFAIHTSLLTRSGQDDDFVGIKYQSTLIGNKNYNSHITMTSREKFFELQLTMISGQENMRKGHPYHAIWYTWPLMNKPILFWVNDAKAPTARIYLIGNIVIWLSIWPLYIYGVFLLMKNYKKLRPEQTKILFILLLSFMLNFLPFGGINREMFLYHYIVAYIFSLMVAIYVWDTYINIQKQNKKYINILKVIYFVILLTCICVFVYLSPIIYGWQITNNQYEKILFIKSWR